MIVVISESQETASEVGLGETMRTAQIQDIMIYPVRLSTIKGWFKRDDKPIPPSIPPGVQARASIPGAAETPTTQMQHRVRATPNVIPIVIDLVRGVKNLLFNNPLELLAVGTGGRVYSPMTEDGIQKAIMGIGEDLRSQYLLSYRPNNLNDSGIFHRIEVEVFYDRARVRARPGYWQGPRAGSRRRAGRTDRGTISSGFPKRVPQCAAALLHRPLFEGHPIESTRSIASCPRRLRLARR